MKEMKIGNITLITNDEELKAMEIAAKQIQEEYEYFLFYGEWPPKK